jgi:hypothetical protein
VEPELEVRLKGAEWQQVMAIIATAPWRDANPLLMKIGEQLRLQPQPSQHHKLRPDGDGKEADHG